MLNARDTLLGHNLREGKRIALAQNRYCAIIKPLVLPVTRRTVGKTQVKEPLKCWHHFVPIPFDPAAAGEYCIE